jgi:hypothetical protein
VSNHPSKITNHKFFGLLWLQNNIFFHHGYVKVAVAASLLLNRHIACPNQNNCMKKSYAVYIPEPCHEDWQRMTPVAQGRFCHSCAKHVIDFSTMTDEQILTHISKAAGGMCGRFANDQLQRPLLPAKQETKNRWWVAAMLPLVMFFEKAGAQKKTTQKTKPAYIKHNYVRQTLGLVAPRIILQPIAAQAFIKTVGEIKGRVINEKGEGVPFASVFADNQQASAMADSSGFFIIKYHNNAGNVKLKGFAVGFGEGDLTVTNENIENIELTLKEETKTLPEVFASSHVETPMLCGVAGGVSITRKDTIFEKFDTLIRTVFHKEQFKTFPNPAPAGSNITVDVTKPGQYAIQLFNNNGQLIQVKQFDAPKGYTQTAFLIPKTVAAGVYYIRLVDNKTSKQYTNKIAVQ